jgi:hypothetical protein
MLRVNDQRDEDDGVTADDTLLPNVIGWGETPMEAILDLSDQVLAIFSAVSTGISQLDNMTES